MNTKIVLFFILFLSQTAFSQEENKEIKKKYSLFSVADIFRNKDSIKAAKPKKKTNFIAFPTLGYQPANGFTLGLISQYSFKEKQKNKISLLSGGASYSTQKQILTYLKNNMFLKDD